MRDQVGADVKCNVLSWPFDNGTRGVGLKVRFQRAFLVRVCSNRVLSLRAKIFDIFHIFDIICAPPWALLVTPDTKLGDICGRNVIAWREFLDEMTDPNVAVFSVVDSARQNGEERLVARFIHQILWKSFPWVLEFYSFGSCLTAVGLLVTSVDAIPDY